LYSALLLVNKYTISGVNSNTNVAAALADGDFAAGKKQVLVFTDTDKIDANYKVASIKIDGNDGEVKDGIACTAAGKCTIGLSIGTVGS
jgi:hypothetical protein